MKTHPALKSFAFCLPFQKRKPPRIVRGGIFIVLIIVFTFAQRPPLQYRTAYCRKPRTVFGAALKDKADHPVGCNASQAPGELPVQVLGRDVQPDASQARDQEPDRDAQPDASQALGQEPDQDDQQDAFRVQGQEPDRDDLQDAFRALGQKPDQDDQPDAFRAQDREPYRDDPQGASQARDQEPDRDDPQDASQGQDQEPNRDAARDPEATARRVQVIQVVRAPRVPQD